jgi:hypothetical protein
MNLNIPAPKQKQGSSLKNGDFPENGFNDFDYISSDHGGHLSN